MNAEKQRAYRDRRRGQPPRQPAPCGTLAAYRRHQRHGEPIDQACRLAYNAEHRRLYANRRSTQQPAKSKGTATIMSINPDIDDLLTGGAAAYKFENVGDTCRGKIVKASTQQQTDFATGAPKTFPSGDPMMQIVVTIAQEDGEEAALYFKGGKFEAGEGTGQSSLEALKTALGSNKLEVGGTLAMKFSGYGKPTKGQPPKLYVCQYTPPAPAAIDPNEDLF